KARPAGRTQGNCCRPPGHNEPPDALVARASRGLIHAPDDPIQHPGIAGVSNVMRRWGTDASVPVTMPATDLGHGWIPACHYASRVCVRDRFLPVTIDSYRFSRQYNRTKI